VKVSCPSTHASIIGTIIDRYAQLVSNALVPTFTAFAVTALLENTPRPGVLPSFTSRMEQTLDDTGEAEWLPYLRQLSWLGAGKLANVLDGC